MENFNQIYALVTMIGIGSIRESMKRCALFAIILFEGDM